LESRVDGERERVIRIRGLSKSFGSNKVLQGFDLDVMRGTGNVFADFGDADAEAKKLKATIAAEIIATLNARKLTMRAAAELTKVDAADIQRIRNADLSRFTIDRLVRVAYRLGRTVEMKVLPARPGMAA
jgi:predicted XRE-type DNA-binding protein